MDLTIRSEYKTSGKFDSMANNILLVLWALSAVLYVCATAEVLKCLSISFLFPYCPLNVSGLNPICLNTWPFSSGCQSCAS